MVSPVNKVWLVLPLFLFGCSGQRPTSASLPQVSAKHGMVVQNIDIVTAFDAEAASKAIESWHHLQKPDEDLQQIETFSVPDSPTLCVAICDHEPRWWGFFGLYELQEGHVSWQAEFDKPPNENSIRWLRARTLKGFVAPIIEVYGMTHMGNGNLYLYELQNRKLVLLLTTRAVDDHWGDGFVFRDGRLVPEYVDLNGDGVTDLMLNGDVEEREEHGNRLVSIHPWQMVFLWDKESHRFEEDRSRRIGLDGDNDR